MNKVYSIQSIVTYKIGCIKYQIDTKDWLKLHPSYKTRNATKELENSLPILRKIDSIEKAKTPIKKTPKKQASNLNELRKKPKFVLTPILDSPNISENLENPIRNKNEVKNNSKRLKQNLPQLDKSTEGPWSADNPSVDFPASSSTSTLVDGLLENTSPANSPLSDQIADDLAQNSMKTVSEDEDADEIPSYQPRSIDEVVLVLCTQEEDYAILASPVSSPSSISEIPETQPLAKNECHPTLVSP